MNSTYSIPTQSKNRKFSVGYATSYAFGFNGQERDDEVSGAGNSYTAEFWQYDPRLGRRFNLDPIIKIHESPYATFANNPVWFADPNGADSAQRASAVQQAISYTENNKGYKMGAKGAPGEKVDCSGLISNCVLAGEESDPNVGTQTSGILNIQANANLTSVDQQNIQPGNIVTFYMVGYDYPYHGGIITKIAKNAEGVVTGFTMAESNGSQGQVLTEVVIGQNRANGGSNNYGTNIQGYYKWDKKADAVAIVKSIPTFEDVSTLPKINRSTASSIDLRIHYNKLSSMMYRNAATAYKQGFAGLGKVYMDAGNRWGQKANSFR